MSDFDLGGVKDKQQLSFQMLVCMRDVISIAKKTSTMPTYERSLELFHDFSPELYLQISTNLPQRNLSDEAKLYVALAEVESKKLQKEVTPLEVLDDQISDFEEKLEEIDKTEDYDSYRVLSQKVGNLGEVRKSLKPRKLSENRILNRDNALADRRDYGAQFVQSDDFRVDYRLSKTKYLRIRLLHPDKPEHVTGADLIYEQHNEKTGMVRILMLQYKTWENGILYFSQAANLSDQAQKMHDNLCKKDFCLTQKTSEGKVAYRFPCCSGFLRPTDKLQFEKSKLVSSGVHIPICQIIDLIDAGKISISRDNFGLSILDQDLFEPLFNRGFIGSGWIPEKELKEFYEEKGIIEKGDSVTFFVREITMADKDSIVEIDL